MENNSFPWYQHTLSISLDTARGIGTKTGWVNFVFPPGDLWIGSNANPNCADIYDLCLDA